MNLQQNQAIISPADNLVGHTLHDGWIITEKLPKPGTAGADTLTGAFFSIGYIASKGQVKAFLKVIDVAQALRFHSKFSLMEQLKIITETHGFECSILDICAKAKLDRIIRIIAKGELPPPDGTGIAIPYILFELADGDIRQIVAKTKTIDDARRLRVLHNVAVGLKQLHGQQIAHQDIKPSNVLLFEEQRKGAKIGDLGRASLKGMDSHHDGNDIAGAHNYAPPEQVYGIRPERWEDRREGCDLYQLGSLVSFVFTGITPTDYYMTALSADVRPVIWNGHGTTSYESALPILITSFTVFVEEIQSDIPAWAAADLSRLVFNACNPDYTKRGDPNARKRVGSPLGMDTFISVLDRLAKRALVQTRQ